MKSLPVEGVRAAVPIGARLRNARMARRYTLEQAATLAGMTKGFLSRVERDLTSPSVASLVTLCSVLQIDVGSLFTAPSTTFVPLDEAPQVEMGGHGIDERLVTGPTERSVQMIRAVIEPGGHGEEDLYSVDCALEVVHVVQGRLELTLTEGTHVLDPGDTLTFPGREPHTWRNLDDGVTVAIFVLLPTA